MASSRGRWASPERTMVWTEPPKKTRQAARPGPGKKVPVVYYLSRNGQLEHPHFMEVSLSVSSPPQADGLYLRDVLGRLNVLRGDGIADMYSWSSKRSYKNGYVWHDLTPDDLVHPAHGNEYVLKGSELLLLASASASSSSSSSCPDKTPTAAPARAARRKNWSSFDLAEYRVAELCAADAATQTTEPTTELGIDEISPPPSSSSPETLETLIKNDARLAAAATTVAPQCEVGAAESRDAVGVNVIAGGRMRASAVLMQLVSCGSITVKDAAPRGRSGLSTEADGFSGSMAMDRDYFSGSLIETKKTTSDHAGAGELKRSSSYNADRGRGVNVMKLEVAEELEGVRARCIPRKPSKLASASTQPKGTDH